MAGRVACALWPGWRGTASADCGGFVEAPAPAGSRCAAAEPALAPAPSAPAPAPAPAPAASAPPPAARLLLYAANPSRSSSVTSGCCVNGRRREGRVHSVSI